MERSYPDVAVQHPKCARQDYPESLTAAVTTRSHDFPAPEARSWHCDWLHCHRKNRGHERMSNNSMEQYHNGHNDLVSVHREIFLRELTKKCCYNTILPKSELTVAGKGGQCI